MHPGILFIIEEITMPFSNVELIFAMYNGIHVNNINMHVDNIGG